MARPPARIVAAFAITGLSAWLLGFLVDQVLARALALPDGATLVQVDPSLSADLPEEPPPTAAAEPPSPTPSRRPGSRRGASRTELIDPIIDRSIFDSARVGSRTAGPKTDGPESKSDLDARLLATIVAEPQELSSALISRTNGAAAKGYGIGDSLFGEGKVVGIEPRRVIIERNDGSREYIEMGVDKKPSTTTASRSMGEEKEGKEEGVEKIGENKFVVDARLVEEAMKDPEKLASQMRVTPHKGADGQIEGYRMSGIRRNSLFSKLGIKNGDIVHAVNGKPLTSVSSAMSAYETLQKEKNFSFEITRRNQRQTFEYEVR